MNRQTALAFAAACGGIALYSVMDALMKGLSLALGAYPAMFWRMSAGLVLTATLFALSRPALPSGRMLRIHLARSMVITVMALSFFWGIARLPLAEAIALSFIAPLIALGLAATFLHERIGSRSVLGSLLGLAGVAVILAGRIGGSHGEAALWGAGAVLLSAVFYAVNLVMARHQAQLARPIEIAFFQNLFILVLLLPLAPVWLAPPRDVDWPPAILAAALGVVSLLLLSWAYARAEAQVLLTVEYTAFVWAALMGWWMFGEPLTLVTIAGTLLIVAGCLLAVRGKAGAAPEAETALP